MIAEKNIKFFTDWAFEEFGFSASDILLSQVPETFDLSVLDIYAFLTFGCKLVPVSKKISSNPMEIVSCIKKYNVNSIFSTPSFFNLLSLDRNFDEKILPTLARFLLCGEIFQKSLAIKLLEKFSNVDLYNLYGPTESTVAVTSIKITSQVLSDNGPLPIGRPMGDMQCLFLDVNGIINEDKEEGEMAFTGNTVGLGYLNMPEKTAESFVNLKDSKNRLVRAYRTGDNGFLAKNGLLYYKGRNDEQIKLSGHRIEIGEIEYHINNLTYVKSAAILPLRLANGNVSALIAFAVVEDGYADEKKIKSDIATHLPSYMIPSTFKFIHDMPTTRHGKINKKKLKENHENIQRS